MDSERAVVECKCAVGRVRTVPHVRSKRAGSLLSASPSMDRFSCPWISGHVVVRGVRVVKE